MAIADEQGGRAQAADVFFALQDEAGLAAVGLLGLAWLAATGIERVRVRFVGPRPALAPVGAPAQIQQGAFS